MSIASTTTEPEEAAPSRTPAATTPAAGTTAPAGSLISISLDLDNLWSYMKTHGDAGWDAFPSYLDPCAEIVLDCLRRNGLTITVFVVGQDAALERNHAALGSLAGAGHDLGNHSFHHEPWLHLYSPAEVDREITTAEEHIERATGRRPRGFRGPGFSFSPDVLRVLARRGYEYDASTFPTFLGPLARAYYFMKSRGMSPAEREKRNKLFGSATEGFRPLKPYRWDLGDASLVEIPVTTMPVLRAPFHLSYLLYLARFSESGAMAYLNTAVRMLKLARVEPSFLLHPLDFLGGDKVKELSFFPGMDLTTDFKTRFFDRVMSCLKRHFTPVTMGGHAQAIVARGTAPLLPAVKAGASPRRETMRAGA